MMPYNPFDTCSQGYPLRRRTSSEHGLDIRRATIRAANNREHQFVGPTNASSETYTRGPWLRTAPFPGPPARDGPDWSNTPGQQYPPPWDRGYAAWGAFPMRQANPLNSSPGQIVGCACHGCVYGRRNDRAAATAAPGFNVASQNGYQAVTSWLYGQGQVNPTPYAEYAPGFCSSLATVPLESAAPKPFLFPWSYHLPDGGGAAIRSPQYQPYPNHSADPPIFYFNPTMQGNDNNDHSSQAGSYTSEVVGTVRPTTPRADADSWTRPPTLAEFMAMNGIDMHDIDSSSSDTYSSGSSGEDSFLSQLQHPRPRRPPNHNIISNPNNNSSNNYPYQHSSFISRALDLQARIRRTGAWVFSGLEYLAAAAQRQPFWRHSPEAGELWNKMWEFSQQVMELRGGFDEWWRSLGVRYPDLGMPLDGRGRHWSEGGEWPRGGGREGFVGW